MKFVGMMRVRDEARWIERAIRSLLQICDRVYILNDHSTDETADLARAFSPVVILDSPFEDFSETRDKEWLLAQIAKSEPHADYVICIDGDEELEADAAAKIIQRTRHGKALAVAFHIIYLWNDADHWRVDGIYRDFYRPSLFKLLPDKTARVFRSPYSTSLHCSNAPAYFLDKTSMSDICLFHWGYFDKQTRIDKYLYYSDKKDPGNEQEDFYRHMVIGDVFPREARFKHGGPLMLEPISTLGSFGL